MKTWQLQHAKNKLSELVEQVIAGEPQMITRRGKPAVVVLTVEEYNKHKNKPEKNFINFLLSIPKLADGMGEVPARANERMREEENS